jgi:DNA helicase HerA-like ATPase
MEHDFTTKNNVVCRKEIDLIQNGNINSAAYEALKNISFIKINGITAFWNTDSRLELTGLTSSILSSIVRHGISYIYAIIGDENGINVYIGVQQPQFDVVCTNLRGSYPGIDIETAKTNPLSTSVNDFGGLFVGLPSDNTVNGERRDQIENICRAMQGIRFTYVVLATGLSGILTTFAQDKLQFEFETVSPFLSKMVSGGAQGNLSVTQQDFSAKRYYETLSLLDKEIKSGINAGIWRVNGYYASDTSENSRKLSALIKSSFLGDDSQPEAFRTVEFNGINDFISNLYMMSELSAISENHPLGRVNVNGRNAEMFIYKYATIMSSKRLGILCNLPAREFKGFYVDKYVEFDVHDRLSKNRLQPINIGTVIDSPTNFELVKNFYTIEKNDFTRHALVVGITGGGKTNTSKSLLTTLWVQEKIPFLVIESAKREYWELCNVSGFEDLIVFTLGDESTRSAVPYRINPFESSPGVSLQTHIDYLLAAFKASFDLYPPAPYILEQAVYEVYTDYGWDTVENVNRYGLTEYPTLSDLYDKIEIIVDRLGYHSEVKSNVKAALSARIYSLMIGGKGRMLNTRKSIPISKLLSYPVILELEDLGDDETKSFVIGMLLVQLYEYRKSQMTSGSKMLSHILLVEEAHRLLKNVSETSESGNNRARAVEFFCNMLAEIRTYGQGIIIADQIPTKLASDTIKNTNLKIVHRTVSQDDRETIGGAMNMSPEQIEYLSSLKRGFAAVYSEGDNRPKLVRMPLVKHKYDKRREDILIESRINTSSLLNTRSFVNHTSACGYCEHRCDFHSRAAPYIHKKVDSAKVLAKWKASDYMPKALKAFLSADLMLELGDLAEYQQICVIGVILQQSKDITSGKQKKVIADYLDYIYKNIEE